MRVYQLCVQNLFSSNDGTTFVIWQHFQENEGHDGGKDCAVVRVFRIGCERNQLHQRYFIIETCPLNTGLFALNICELAVFYDLVHP